jgi:hypothetical protein
LWTNQATITPSVNGALDASIHATLLGLTLANAFVPCIHNPHCATSLTIMHSQKKGNCHSGKILALTLSSLDLSCTWKPTLRPYILS